MNVMQIKSQWLGLGSLVIAGLYMTDKLNFG